MLVADPDKQGGQIPDFDQWLLYNMSGGAVWNKKADHGIVVLRPDKNDPTSIVKIAKFKRHATMGRPGTVRMRFNPLLATYEGV